MKITLSAGTLQQALGGLSDITMAYQDKFANLSEDETVVFDAIDFIGPLIGGPFGMLAPILAPVLANAALWIVENNQSGTPGSQMEIRSVSRGSDPNRGGAT